MIIHCVNCFCGWIGEDIEEEEWTVFGGKEALVQESFQDNWRMGALVPHLVVQSHLNRWILYWEQEKKAAGKAMVGALNCGKSYWENPEFLWRVPISLEPSLGRMYAMIVWENY